MINRANLTARLALPPTHADFPHRALLHAICAVSGRYSAAVRCSSVAEVIKRSDDGMMGIPPSNAGMSVEDRTANEPCFVERNVAYALQAIDSIEVRGRRMLETLQALVGGTYLCARNLLISNRSSLI
jgi:hypothetical protein